MARGVRIGDYQIEHELAVGPSVAIYRAVHSVLPRRVLLKVAREPGDSVAVLREACILAALPHPGIVRVYETGRLADLRTWFAYEIVEGLMLAGTFVLGAIEAAIAVGMIRDVAEVLAYAHQRGVIHGGVTPERLVVTGRGRGFPMCITDWSAARAHDAEAMSLGEPTPFTAPELIAGDTIDDRADVFALGVVAYRALTGELPREPLVPTAVHCPEVPRELSGLIDQMLAFERWDRPSAAEVRAELGSLATSLTAQRAPDVVRIRKPRWTPQIDLGTRMRADTEADPGILPSTRDDVE
ncbi:MAG: serine/threonine-protein kinase [Kofleriaceae bacterium]